MKIKKLLLSVITASILTSVAFAASKVTQDVGVIPAQGMSYIKTNFPDVKIMSIKIDKTLFSIDDYEIMLEDGTEIELKPNGEWTSVENKIKGVPLSTIPVPVRQYIRENYPEKKVIEVQKKKYGFQVELDNRFELKFSESGQFLGLDD